MSFFIICAPAGSDPTMHWCSITGKYIDSSTGTVGVGGGCLVESAGSLIKCPFYVLVRVRVRACCAVGKFTKGLLELGVC